MFVRQILRSKGEAIVSIQPTARIADITALMSQKRIGAVVVLDARGQLVGIVSERDIAHGLA